MLAVIVLIQLFDRKNMIKMKKRDIVLFDEYEPKTGDILLFSGKSFSPMPTKSFIIKFFTKSDISHVGMIWVDPNTKIPWIWETGPCNKRLKSQYPKIEGRSYYSHMTMLEDKLENVRQQYVIRQINRELNPYKMLEFIQNNIGKFYAFDLALSWYEIYIDRALPMRFLSEGCRGSGYWSCGELVAATLQHMGVIDNSIKKKCYFPAQYTKEEDKIDCRNDYSFGKEFLLIK